MPKQSSSSKKILEETGYTFDDLLLLPGFTDFARQDADLTTVLHKNLTLSLPVFSSPMDTVTETSMAVLMARYGGMGVIHRNLSIESQAQMVKEAKAADTGDMKNASVDSKGKLRIGAAVGLGADLEKRVEALVAEGVDLLCIDSGHGNTAWMVKAAETVKKMAPNVVLMAGNVATADGAKRLANAGADILRTGMGPGSICTTRVMSGMGVPQIMAIMQACEGVKGTDATVVADGGIRQMGDIAKAIAAGAHAVMLGSMLAGFVESPGEETEVNGKKMKAYRGMGSIGAMKKGSAERYGQSAQAAGQKMIPEGVEGLVPFKGSAEEFLYQLSGSLQSSFYYIGGRTLPEFQEKATFVKMSQAGLRESHPHTLSAIVQTGSNYFV
jgi:IMP dehydrogenase